MQRGLLGQKFFFGFPVILIIHTAINGANGRTLRFIVEAHAFCTLIGNDIIKIHGYRSLSVIGIYMQTAFGIEVPFQACAVGKSPFGTPFIDGIVRAFRLTSPAVDTFFRDFNCHNLKC
jgi:hypothetical protein